MVVKRREKSLTQSYKPYWSRILYSTDRVSCMQSIIHLKTIHSGCNYWFRAVQEDPVERMKSSDVLGQWRTYEFWGNFYIQSESAVYWTQVRKKSPTGVPHSLSFFRIRMVFLFATAQYLACYDAKRLKIIWNISCMNPFKCAFAMKIVDCLNVLRMIVWYNRNGWCPLDLFMMCLWCRKWNWFDKTIYNFLSL